VPCPAAGAERVRRRAGCRSPTGPCRRVWPGRIGGSRARTAARRARPSPPSAAAASVGERGWGERTRRSRGGGSGLRRRAGASQRRAHCGRRRAEAAASNTTSRDSDECFRGLGITRAHVRQSVGIHGCGSLLTPTSTPAGRRAQTRRRAPATSRKRSSRWRCTGPAQLVHPHSPSAEMLTSIPLRSRSASTSRIR
jgi:hypothetical protein